MSEKKSAYPPFRQSGRLKGEPRKELLQYVYPGPPERDQFILRGVHLYDLAHTVMLREKGILTKEEAQKILAAFQEMEKQGMEKVRMRTQGGIHSGESFLTQKVGKEIAGKLPTGRSTGDLNSASRRLAVRDGLTEVMKASLGLRDALLSRAEENLDSIMPGYSHGKRQQPSTFAQYCLFWVCPLERDFERLHGAFSRANVSTASHQILFASRYALDRKRVAELLGFDGLMEHNGDANWNYDFWLEAFSAVVILLSTVSRLAESLNLFSGDEFGLVDLDDGFCWTSSVMPHKKNPYPLQYLKSLYGVGMGHMVSALAIEKANPWEIILDRNTVAQNAGALFKETVWGLDLTKGIIDTLQVNREWMKQRVGEFWEQSTDLALAISREKGIPMRTAHHIAGKLVRLAKDNGKGPKDVTPEMLDEAARSHLGHGLGLDSGFIARAFDPWESILSRTVRGGEAPKEVARRIRGHAQRLNKHRKELERIESQIEGAEKKLRQAIHAIIDPSSFAKKARTERLSKS